MKTFDELSALEQYGWYEKIKDLIENRGLSLGDKTIEAAARRLYEQFISAT